jgi:hypothetical protein
VKFPHEARPIAAVASSSFSAASMSLVTRPSCSHSPSETRCSACSPPNAFFVADGLYAGEMPVQVDGQAQCFIGTSQPSQRYACFDGRHRASSLLVARDMEEARARLPHVAHLRC